MKKFWEKIIRVWKDPVWSKVIASIIISIVLTIWAKYNHYSLIEIYDFSVQALTFRLPIYFFASLIGFIFLIRLIIKLYRKRKDPIWDEPIGNYTFDELYRILQRQNLPLKTIGMSWNGMNPPEDDLLTLFQVYSTLFNKGVSIDDHFEDGGYLYGVLSPKLVGYGIVEKIAVKNAFMDAMDTKYQTSELGYKFLAQLEKVIHLKKK